MGQVFNFTKDGLKTTGNEVLKLETSDGQIMRLDPIKLMIGEKVRQAQGGIGVVCGEEAGSRPCYFVIMEDGSGRHHQSVNSISPFTRITPLDPIESVSISEVKALIAKHEQYQRNQIQAREDAQRQKAIEKEQHIAELRILYPNAVAADGKITSHARAAKNIKLELKAAFPGTTFKVRSRTASMMDAVDVDWIDGPTFDQVNAILDKYQDSDFDGYTDSTVSRNSAYGEAVEVVLSRAKYVRGQREVTDDVREAIQRGLAKLQQVEYTGPNTRVINSTWGSAYDQAGQLLNETTIPLTWRTITVVSCQDDNRKHWAKVVFDAPEIEEAATEPTEVETPAATEKIEMRPDVAAYLVQAAVELASEQNFVPQDEDAMQYWMVANHRQICQRAKDLQAALLDKYLAHEKQVTEAMAFSLWTLIRSQQ